MNIVKLQKQRREIDQKVKETFKKLNDKIAESMKNTELGKKLKELIKYTIQSQDKVTIHYRLYVEGKHTMEQLETGENIKKYTKDYNHQGLFDIYAYDSTRTQKYTMCLDRYLTVKRKDIRKKRKRYNLFNK
jgi:hypothetical protein